MLKFIYTYTYIELYGCAGVALSLSNSVPTDPRTERITVSGMAAEFKF
jgi:hypothetical protein